MIGLPIETTSIVKEDKFVIIASTLDMGVALDVCPDFQYADTNYMMIFQTGEQQQNDEQKTFTLERFGENTSGVVNGIPCTKTELTSPLNGQCLALMLSKETLDEIGLHANQKADVTLISSSHLKKPQA